MAIKDWKKVGKNRWRKKEGKTIVIGKLSEEFAPYRYDFYIAGYRWNTIKQFKTKSQALKFAKAYMIKH